jgi:hypothetical protein
MSDYTLSILPNGSVPKRRFCFYYWFVAWDCISFGVHFCPTQPNIEIHLPFGFVRIGWLKTWPEPIESSGQLSWRCFGFKQTY